MSTFVRFALVAALAAAGFGCNQQQNASSPATPAAVAVPATPDAAIAASVKALRDNNIAALVDNALPAAEAVKLKADWNKDMNAEPISDEGPSPEGTPDRWKLFGSHGQRPWLQQVVNASPVAGRKAPKTYPPRRRFPVSTSRLARPAGRRVP